MDLHLNQYLLQLSAKNSNINLISFLTAIIFFKRIVKKISPSTDIRVCKGNKLRYETYKNQNCNHWIHLCYLIEVCQLQCTYVLPYTTWTCTTSSLLLFLILK